MNSVFLAYAVRSMKKHRAGTIVTVIGLMTAMALFTAVAEGANSGIRYFRSNYAYSDGSFQAAYLGASEKEADSLRESPEVDESITMQEVGWAETVTDNPDKPYVRIVSGPMDSGLLPVHMSYGRLPENEEEIILPDVFLLINSHKYELNEKLDLEVGVRTLNGKVLTSLSMHENGESIADAKKHTYTVTGFYDRFCDSAEPREASCYTAVTKSTQTDGISDVYYTLKDIHKLPELESTLFMKEQCTRHKEILMVDAPSLSGASSKVLQTVYGFAAALIAIVVIGAVSLIYNSFSISVAQRTKEYGILRSIGASRKQIRSTVFCEAVITSLLGMIPGILIGLTGIAVTLHFTGKQISTLYADSPVQIRFAFSWKALLLCCLICTLTALLSAWRPAGRAVQITPMDAIRSRQDIKDTGKLRVHPKADRHRNLTALLTRRNHQRFASGNRSAVFSIAVSIILFVSASVLVSDLMKNVRQAGQNDAGDIGVSMHQADSEQLGRMYQNIRKIPVIDDGMYAFAAGSENFYEITIDDALVSDAYRSAFESKSDLYEDQNLITTQELYFLDDGTFRKVLKEHGLRAEEYFDASSPRGLLFNQDSSSVNGKVKTVPMLDSSVTDPFSVHVTSVKTQEGLAFDGIEKKNGTNTILFYRKAYLNSLQEGETPDVSKVVKIPASEAVETNDLVIGNVLNEDETLGHIFYGVTVVYPASLYPALRDSSLDLSAVSNQDMNFTSSRSEEAEQEIRTLLKEENLPDYSIINFARDRREARSMVAVIRVFSDAFVILTACIAAANVINIIMTGMNQRRKEFAMLRSVGMTASQFQKMFRKEIFLTASKALLFAIPASVLLSWLIWKPLSNEGEIAWQLPVLPVLLTSCIAILVFSISMRISWHSIACRNLSEELRNEIS